MTALLPRPATEALAPPVPHARAPAVSGSARRFKVLRSSRAPAQRALFAAPTPIDLG